MPAADRGGIAERPFSGGSDPWGYGIDFVAPNRSLANISIWSAGCSTLQQLAALCPTRSIA